MLGRSKECDVRIAHLSVSRMHVKFSVSDMGFHVMDLGSRNGTFRNGQRISEAEFQDGDLLRIGSVKLRVAYASQVSAGLAKEESNEELHPPRSHLFFDEDWSPGLEVFEGCFLEKQIGDGGFGQVWRASRRGKRAIAVKRIAVSDGAPNEARAMKLLQGIRHPHIARLLGFEHYRGTVAVGMELGDETLQQHLEKCRARGLEGIPQQRLLQFTFQVAEALDHLFQARQILHRDIKPSNVLLVRGTAKLCDFGLAKVLKHAMMVHTGVASFEFAPPEYFDRRVAPTSDQFSLAAMYCYLMTGRLPFSAGDVRQIAMKHVKGEIEMSSVPETQHPILRQAMARSPDDRFKSCMAFAEALEKVAGVETNVHQAVETDPITDE
ncbi:Serine/threonine-protein kinase PknF [Planctomycetes bacterium Pan216]|uniref:Serine/threonine-protein kinase PknF n=1 Tax=Kolteria novifilia TaxID=2527975 RepID=A0A518B1F1_9BACT|nr:Serine/threonine-protein kinase PknF [Planctomycetes bacterium Pan216]